MKAGNVTCVDGCRCLIFAHKGPAPQFLLVSARWCACLLPFTIFPFSLPESPTHTRPFVCWYDLSNPSDTHIHTHMDTHTEALSVTASLFSHWDTLSTFIASSQWGTLSERSPSTLGLHSISPGPGLLRAAELQPASFTALHIKLSSQHSSTHSIRKTHQAHKYCRNYIILVLKYPPVVHLYMSTLVFFCMIFLYHSKLPLVSIILCMLLK